MGCRNPGLCRKKATDWKIRQMENIPMGEQILQNLLAFLEDGGSLPMSKHAARRGYLRVFSGRDVSEVIRNGWIIEHNTARKTLLILYYLKITTGLYRPVHIVLAYKPKWKVITVYDPRTKPWKWNRNYDERICFCD